ncbi:MAG: DNA polymerase, partial [Planctomycetia bacterium]
SVRGLRPIQEQRMADEGLGPLFHDIEMPLIGVLVSMENLGVAIDVVRLEEIQRQMQSEIAELTEKIHDLAGGPFTIDSPKQLAEVLFERLGLPAGRKGKPGYATDRRVLRSLEDKHPIVPLVVRYRELVKLEGTYLAPLPGLVDPADGRIHTTFNQTVTATGRLSSSEPNLQNLPTRTPEGRLIRTAFLPREPGWRFISADYSQIELRILAHLSHDDAMLAAFAAGEDIHTRTAAAVYGVEPAAVTAAMRRTAKAVNFGILYGQSSFGLAKALGIPKNDAAAFIAAYFRSFAGAAGFMDDVLDRCRREGQVVTMLGRRRTIAGVRDRANRRNSAGIVSLTLPERTAVNTVVQGSAADLIKLAMLRVSRRLAEAGLRSALVLQIHDELLLEAPDGEAEAVKDLVVSEMRQAMRLDVPLDVSVHEGLTWAACEKA